MRSRNVPPPCVHCTSGSGSLDAMGTQIGIDDDDDDELGRWDVVRKLGCGYAIWAAADPSRAQSY